MRLCVTGAVALLLAVGLVLVGYVLAGGRLPAPPKAALRVVSEINLVEWAAEAGLGVVVAPVVEEIIYRGVLMPALLAKAKPWTAVVIGAAVFGFLHAIPYGYGANVWVETFGGLLMGIVYVYRKSILSGMVVHAIGNATLAAGMILYIYVSKWMPHLA